MHQTNRLRVRAAILAVLFLVSTVFLTQPHTGQEESFVLVSARSGPALPTAPTLPNLPGLPATLSLPGVMAPIPTTTPVEVSVAAPPPPTPVPTPTSPPPPPPQPFIPSNEVARMVYDLWPEEATKAKAVCLVGKESGYNPRAVNPSGKYRGLFQMDSAFWRTYGGHEFAARPDLASVAAQVTVAFRGYQARGFQPWPPARRC